MCGLFDFAEILYDAFMIKVEGMCNLKWQCSANCRLFCAIILLQKYHCYTVTVRVVLL